MAIAGRDVGIGLLIGGSLLTLHAIWPALTDPDQRAPAAVYGEKRDPTVLEDFMTTCILFGALGYGADMLGDLVASPKPLEQLI